MEGLDLPEKIHKDVSATFIVPLDSSNYGSWKKAVRILFMCLNVLPLIDSDKPIDADVLWYKCDRCVIRDLL